MFYTIFRRMYVSTLILVAWACECPASKNKTKKKLHIVLLYIDLMIVVWMGVLNIGLFITLG